MDEITTSTIATNPLAPKSASAVKLYNFGDAKELTLGQLIMAVCIRRASTIEKFSVNKANEVHNSSALLNAMAAISEQILNATSLTAVADIGAYIPKKVSPGCSIDTFLKEELKITGYSTDMTSYDNRSALFALIKPQIDAQAAYTQEQTIDLQSQISRRDVIYNTSANVARSLGSSLYNISDKV